MMFEAVFSTLAEMFGYTFLLRAFVVGALVSVCAALLGVSLVLKRYSMIGDGLSHVGFGALAIATALGAAPLLVSIPLVVAAAFLLLRLGGERLIKGDAAIALISTSSLAIGVTIISLTTGMNTDVCNYLFGSILAMNKTDVYLSVVLSAVVLVLFIVFYNKLFAIVFDETFAKGAGVKTGVYNMLIALLTAITIVLGMRMMGAMLISALIVFPALTSMRIFKTFKGVTICSVCVSAVCYFTGIIISYIYAMPTGASVVMMNLFVFAVFCVLKKLLPHKRKLLIPVLCTIALCSCSKSTSGAVSKTEAESDAKAESEIVSEVVEVKEKMFIAQTNDIYLNPDEYLGKVIKLQGLFKVEEGFNKNYYFVLRYGPGCCGSDGNAGFEVAWEGQEADGAPVYPAQDDWVEAEGVLKSYEEDGFPFLYLSLVNLTKPAKRGAEFVTQ